MVAAPRVEDDRYAALEYTVGNVQDVLTPKEIIQLSRVVPLEKASPVWEAITQTVQVEDGLVELRHEDVAGIGRDRACILMSRQPEDALDAA